MNEKQYNLYKKILQCTPENLQAVLYMYLSKTYKTVVQTKDYLYAVGDIPVALVCHLDTVFKTPPQPNEVFFDREAGVIWSPKGCGHDDRAGAYALVTLLERGLRPHVICTQGEEIGGVGASALAEEKCPFKDLRYMIELDRRGRQDMVFYDCDNKEFINYVGSFGFALAYGSFTDISFLMDAWGVAGVNLSCGYMSEHSDTEFLRTEWLEATIDKVETMLENAKEAPFFEYIPSPHYWRWTTPSVDEKNSCFMCGKALAPEERVPVELENGISENFCIDCAASVEVDWCETCGNAFMGQQNQRLCYSCEDRLMGPYNF